MEKYLYTAKNEDGKKVRGYENAENEQELYRKLREQQLYLLSAAAAREQKGSRRLNAKTLAEFSRELGTMLQAGVPLIRALTILASEETVKPAQKKLYDDILSQLRQGISFSDALEAQGNAFPELMIHMMRTAEVSGNLDEVSLRLAVYYEKEYKLRGKVRSAMAYPAVLLVIIFAVVLIIFTYVLPQFAQLFEDSESLPLSTRVMFGISDAIRLYWIQILIIAAFILVLFKALLGISGIKYRIDRRKLRLPIVGKLLKVVYTARFARTLSSLYSSGIPMITSLQIGSQTIGNTYIEGQFDEVIRHIRSGESLSQALGTVDGFVKKFASTVLVGEETGKLGQMLNSMADTLDFESERAIESMVSILEPLMIVVMAVIVGFVVISVIGPIYGSYDVIGAGA